MRKAGGIIGIIAGIFALLAAFVTLFIGGLGAAFQAQGAIAIVGLGWGGVFFAFMTIVFGAICLATTARIYGIVLMLCALAGAVLGGTLVAVFMILALMGGILASLSPKHGSSGNT